MSCNTLCASQWPDAMLTRRSTLAKLLWACAAFCLSLLPLPWGLAHANVPPSAQVSSVLEGATWVGSSRLRFFGLDVYDANLWTAPDFKSSAFEQYPLVLELTYLRGLSGNSIAERSLKEMRRNAVLQPEQETRWLVAMQQIFPDVRSGDKLVGLHTPGTGARFWLNGQARGAIDDTDFSRLFFGIWLSPNTSEPKLRAALLQQAAP
jgi:hypothetical protein